jgi:hypothetical protein
MDYSEIAFIADLIEDIYVQFYKEDGSSQDFHNAMVASGYQSIGAGSTRMAFTHELTPTVAYKFGQYGPNGNELAAWNLLPEGTKHYFATFYYTNGLTNAMERTIESLQQEYERLVKLNHNAVYDEASYIAVERKLKKHNVVVFDSHGQNFGRKEDGSVVMIDYGSTSIINDVRHINNTEQLKNHLGSSRFNRVERFGNMYMIRLSEKADYPSQIAPNSEIIKSIKEQDNRSLLFLIKRAVRRYEQSIIQTI